MKLSAIKAMAAGAMALSMSFAPAAFATSYGHSTTHGYAVHVHRTHGYHHAPKVHVIHHVHKHHSYGHHHTPVCVKFGWIVEHGHHKWACLFWK